MRPIFVTAVMAAGAASFLFAGAARAGTDDIVQLKTVGEWHIGVNKGLGYGCFMGTGYSKGTILLLGFNEKAKNGYIMFGNNAWHSVESGKEYPIVFRFNDGTSWNGT